jgi:hypothetical protein
VNVEELAAFLTAQPTATAKLLTQHVDDGHGRCRACGIGGQRGFMFWPCTLYSAALRASRLNPAAADPGIRTRRGGP